MKFLIVRTSSLGDIIQCFPALDFLHRLFPRAAIDWIVEKPFASLLKAHPYIRYVHEIETKRWRRNPFNLMHWKEAFSAIASLRRHSYDLAIDFQGNCKSGLVIGSAKSQKKIGFGLCSVTEWPATLFTNKRFNIENRKPINEHYLDLLSQIFSKENPSGSFQIDLEISAQERAWIEKQPKAPFRVMVCIGSCWENKRLDIKTWTYFLKKVGQKFSPLFYLVWGNQKEREEADQLKRNLLKNSFLVPHMSVPVWQQMIAQMDLLFAVDSSALHLAATTQTPTYSFFGPTASSIYKPPGKRHASYQGECPYGKRVSRRCSRLRTCKSGACLKTLEADLLFEHFSRWFFQAGFNQKC